MIAYFPRTGGSHSRKRRKERDAKAKAAAKAKADAYWLDNGEVCVDAPLPVQPPPNQAVVAVTMLIFLAFGVAALYFALREPPRLRHWIPPVRG